MYQRVKVRKYRAKEARVKDEHWEEEQDFHDV
jgi:hypothetical protein